MAEPISIISLVASILTFVDFGMKIVSGARKIRDSTHGTTAEISELDLIVEDIRSSHDQVKKQQSSGQTLSKDERHVLLMVAECENLVQELKKTIGKLKVRPGVRSKKWESTRVFTQSFLKRNDIQALQIRLCTLDERIRRHLHNTLQEDHRSSIMEKLVEIEVSQTRIGVQEESHFDTIRNDILRLTTQTQQSNETSAATQSAQLTNIKVKLEMLQEKHSACSKQLRVLRSLYFPEIDRRWNTIKEANEQSEKWIFDRKQTSFVPWLESAEENDALFYITGRAGSGKSTLMKHIFDHQITKQSLKQWAGSAKLYTAGFYFWNLGTDMQKTKVGLFQSLLYQIFKQAPQLITSVCKDRLDHEVWSMSDLIDVFKRIAQQTGLDSKFWLLIDGLDEYEGEEKDVIDLLRILSMSKHFKICTSSRPGRQFESYVKNEGRTFDIARFTKEDMRVYIDTRLRSSEKWRKILTANSVCQDIVRELSFRAAGVWLWVTLVTDEIVKEAEKNESLDTLRKIVDEFPEDLYDYFKKMIDRIPKQHREEMAQMLLISVYNQSLSELPLYAFVLLEQERKHNNHALSSPMQSLSEAEWNEIYPVWKDRIRNRCSDLLIVEDPAQHGQPLGPPVSFVHRSVLEFLREYDSELRLSLKAEFDPFLSLIKICLGLLKACSTSGSTEAICYNQLSTQGILDFAFHIERRGGSDEIAFVEIILDYMDVVNSQYFNNILMGPSHGLKARHHWANYERRESRRYKAEDFGTRSFLNLAIERGLICYVRAKAQKNPSSIRKRGTFVLDYALRPIQGAMFDGRFFTCLDINMVQLLLDHGADPNERIPLNNNLTVWETFIDWMIMTNFNSDYSGRGLVWKDAWFQACEAMIRAGARSDREDLKISSKFVEIFGISRATKLERLMKQMGHETKHIHRVEESSESDEKESESEANQVEDGVTQSGL